MRNTTLATLRKLLKNSFLTVLLLALPLGASAAGLGKLTVLSALGRPLRAEVDISASREELSSLSARIASPNAFQQAGIEYSPALSGIRFTVGQRPDGQPFLTIQSDRPFNEPFLDMLVELNWASGRLVREYTFLLDPPESMPKPLATSAAPLQLPETKREAAATVQVQVPANVSNQPERFHVAPLVQPDETLQKKPRPEMKVTRGDDGVQRIVKVEQSEQARVEKQVTTRLVKRGDTLGKIAAETKPEGVNLDQMLLALFRGNQEAFAGNVSRLKAGKILAIPDRETVAGVNADEARKTIQAHAADFNAYSKKLASTVASSPAAVQEAPKRAVSGKIAPRVEDKAPVAAAGKDKLEVSKTEVAPGAAGKAGAERIAAIEETLVSREKALKDANGRIAELEKNLNDLKKLVELKNQGLADLQKQAQAAKPAAPAAVVKEPAEATGKPVEKAAAKPDEELPPAAAPKPAEPVQPVAAAKPAEPVTPAPATVDKKPVPPAPPAPPATEPNFVDDSPEIVYGSGGILILLLGYLGYSRWRKQREAGTHGSDDKIADQLTLGGSGDRNVSDELLPTDLSSQSEVLGIEPVAAVDPVAEADVYLAYGRDAQAEEILLDALKTDPTRHAIHLKLLEIYAKRKSVKQFETIAADLHNQTGGSGPDWEKAVQLAVQIDPENPLYAAKTTAAPEEFDASATMVIQPGNMLADLDLGVAESAAKDLTQSQQTAEIPPEIEPPPQEEVQEEVPVSLDFDFNLPAVTKESVSTESPSADLSLEESPGSLDIDLDLDMAAQEPTPAVPESASPATTTPAASPTEVESGLDFDFDLGDGKALEISAPAEPPETPAPAEPTDSNVIDFDLELPEPAVSKPAAAGLDLSSISLELNQPLDSTPPAETSQMPALDDAALQDVATKIELAQAYEDMGDKEGARELLQEVLNEGNAAQQETARNKLDQLG
ncbi:MAG: pilus assembly protein [Sterolibacterium sp.]|nr:pilus assembly protein [Sterolibacterium sp.]